MLDRSNIIIKWNCLFFW